MPKLRKALVLPLLVLIALFASECATPTALTITIYSEVACAKGSAVALVGDGSLAGLAQRAPSSVSTTCGTDGRMGTVVVVPAGAKDDTVAFAVMQRADGQPADACLDPAQTSGCIVAKRQLRFETHTESDMRVDLRIRCLGMLCSPDQTCVTGTCVDAQTTCGASCNESALLPTADGGAPDGGMLDSGAAEGSVADGGAREGGAPDASSTSGLVALTISAGTLSPVFSPATLGYSVAPSVVSLGAPFTVTPIFTSGYAATVNGAGVGSGENSPVIPLNLLTPTPIDVALFPNVGPATHYAIVVPPLQEAYAKASNPRVNAFFGSSIALSGDTLAVGAPLESSNGTGVNGNQADTSAASAGAVYVFTRTGATWSQQAYVKASNTRAGALFGSGIALDGDTLAVGSANEASNATGINGNQADTSLAAAGAVYIFTRSGTTWSQQAYAKASNTRASATFGAKLALSGDTLAVGSSGETSDATGINGNQADTTASAAGAVYVFTRTGTTWSQEAYVKASNTRAAAGFGYSVAVSSDTLAVGSYNESSGATGIDGNQASTSAMGSGAAYVFTRTGTTWSQQAYVKASNTRTSAFFGASVALSGDTLAVGSVNESSGAAGVNGNQADTSAAQAGAVYVFTRTGTAWSQEAYLKASNPRANSYFGTAVAVAGGAIAIGSYNESSDATGINGDQADTSASSAGAVYLFTRSGAAWSQEAYVKASNGRHDSQLGSSVALTGDTLAAGAPIESSNASGINGDQADMSFANAGAVYVLR